MPVAERVCVEAPRRALQELVGRVAAVDEEVAFVDGGEAFDEEESCAGVVGGATLPSRRARNAGGECESEGGKVVLCRVGSPNRGANPDTSVHDANPYRV